MYLRLYITHTLLGYLLDLDASNVKREIHGRMISVLSEVLPVSARDEPLLLLNLAASNSSSSSSSSSSGGGGGGKRKRKKKIGTLEELLEEHPEFKEVFIDATEQELPGSPRTRAAAKTSTVANEKGTPRQGGRC
jgi:hypothetical protein